MKDKVGKDLDVTFCSLPFSQLQLEIRYLSDESRRHSYDGFIYWTRVEQQQRTKFRDQSATSSTFVGV